MWRYALLLLPRATMHMHKLTHPTLDLDVDVHVQSVDALCMMHMHDACMIMMNDVHAWRMRD
jgi:hypothetical protein